MAKLRLNRWICAFIKKLAKLSLSLTCMLHVCWLTLYVMHTVTTLWRKLLIIKSDVRTHENADIASTLTWIRNTPFKRWQRAAQPCLYALWMCSLVNFPRGILDNLREFQRSMGNLGELQRITVNFPVMMGNLGELQRIIGNLGELQNIMGNNLYCCNICLNCTTKTLTIK